MIQECNDEVGNLLVRSFHVTFCKCIVIKYETVYVVFSESRNLRPVLLCCISFLTFVYFGCIYLRFAIDYIQLQTL